MGGTIPHFLKDTIYEGLQEGDVTEAAINSLSYGGDGVSRVDGLTVFVPRAVPGETHRIKIVKRKKRYARGISQECLVPSAIRQTPECIHFTSCGGCHYQHVPYETSLEAKITHVKDLFQRLAGIKDIPLLDAVRPRSPWAYRNKMTLHRADNGAQGYTRWLDYQIEDIHSCKTVQPTLQHAWEKIKPLLVSFSATQLPSVVFRATTENNLALIFTTPALENLREKFLTMQPTLNAQLNTSISLGAYKIDPLSPESFPIYEHIAGPEHLKERVAGYDYTVFPDSFFQVNIEIAEKLLQTVLTGVKSLNPKFLLDFYCGVGFFSIAAAHEGIPVLGVESGYRAILAAQHQAKLSNLTNATFRTGKIEKLFRKLQVEGYKSTVAVLDPPRGGLEPNVAPELMRMGVKDIFYVSCAPSTLARDVKQFTDLGYKLQSVQPFDMFPQTYHIEVLAILKR